MLATVNAPATVTGLVPLFVILKVKFASKPEESKEVSAALNASVSPPSIYPLVLFHRSGELPMKRPEAPVLSVRKVPC